MHETIAKRIEHVSEFQSVEAGDEQLMFHPEDVHNIYVNGSWIRVTFRNGEVLTLGGNDESES